MKPKGRAPVSSKAVKLDGDTVKNLQAFKAKVRAAQDKAAKAKALRKMSKDISVVVHFGHGNVISMFLPGNFPHDRARLKAELKKRFPTITSATIRFNGGQMLKINYVTVRRVLSAVNAEVVEPEDLMGSMLTSHREEGTSANFDRYIAGDR